MKAYIFPGQGAQYPGMAKELYDKHAEARELFAKANEVLGYDLGKVMFEGSAEELMRTELTQPAVFMHSYVAYVCLSDGLPDMVAGHSLGELTALAVSGALSFEDALTLVSQRAKAMQKACALVDGVMAAVLLLDEAKVEEICRGIEGVVPANYNLDGQIVISGERKAVEEACEKMKAAGAKKAFIMPIGGAFHAPQMEPARAELAKAIEETPFKDPFCPVYQNVCACAVRDAASIKENLLMQLTSPVKWTQSIRAMLADGADEFIEFGPGTILQKLIKKIALGTKDVKIEGRS